MPPRWLLVMQHFAGMLNAWSFINNVADGLYLFAAISLLCVLLTASWRLK